MSKKRQYKSYIQEFKEEAVVYAFIVCACARLG